MALANHTAQQSKGSKAPRKELDTAPTGKAVSGGEGQRKRSFKNRIVSLPEIHKHQKTTELLLHKKPFNRLVCEIAHDRKSDLRFQPNAMKALQEAAEAFLVECFEDTNKLGIHN